MNRFSKRLTEPYSRVLLLALSLPEILALLLAFWLSLPYMSEPWHETSGILYVGCLLWLSLLLLTGAMSAKVLPAIEQWLKRSLLAMLNFGWIFLLLSSSMHLSAGMYQPLALFWAIFFFFSFSSKLLIVGFFQYGRHHMSKHYSYCIVGYNPEARAIHRYLQQQYPAARFMGFYEEDSNLCPMADTLQRLLSQNNPKKIKHVYFTLQDRLTALQLVKKWADNHYVYFHYVLPVWHERQLLLQRQLAIQDLVICACAYPEKKGLGQVFSLEQVKRQWLLGTA